MNATHPNKPVCPVGEKHCVRLDELAVLRREVDELNELVVHDALTGLYNARHFQQALPAALELTRRSQRPCCLIMVDLDHFKNVNDTWGHEVGNLALQQAARIVTQQVRMVDTVCRYGGEEFAVILPDTRLRQAVDVAERIRTAIAQAPVVFDDGEFQMTTSLGVDTYTGSDDLSPGKFIEQADRLLYQAKQQGRNRVCHRDFEEVESSTAVSREERDALSELFGK